MSKALLIILLLGVPAVFSVPAAQGNAGAVASTATAEGTTASVRPKQKSGPFHGRLKSVDLRARSFVMGQRTFQVSEKTHIVKGGKPATLKDAVVGENVSGSFRTTDDGLLMCVTLRFGPKVEGDTIRPGKTAKENTRRSGSKQASSEPK